MPADAFYLLLENLKKIHQKNIDVDNFYKENSCSTPYCNKPSRSNIVLLKRDLSDQIIKKMNSLTYSTKNEDVICDFDFDLLSEEEFNFYKQFSNVTITKSK
jgi:hypothetical protein